MTNEETSHIEIVVDENESEKIEEKKMSLWKKLADLNGWKKDSKKIFFISILLLVVIGGYFGLRKMPQSFAIRLHAPIEIVNYQKYSQENPTFSFIFSKKFILDGDKQKKYGDDYLVGFHLDADQRTGCDARKSSVSLNFAKSDKEINDAISNDLSQHVKGFGNYSGRRIKIDGQDAMVTEFTLTDPLSNTLHLQQVMVSKGGDSYLLVCGSGQSQYDFYKDDFSKFIESFKFEK